jgi:hypothetical protein
MKRFFSLLGFALVAMTIVSCSNYKEKAKDWACDQIDHFACPDGKRHAIYDLESIGKPMLKKVDLKDEGNVAIITSLFCDDNTTYRFSHLEDFGLPADKGYKGSDSFVVVIEEPNLPKDIHQVAIIYNTYGGPHKKLCQGRFVKAHGFSLVSRCHITGSSISGVDVYDLKGKKLEPKTYEGSIAGQHIVAELVEKDGQLAGSYYYTKYGPGKHRLYIYGEIDEDGYFLIEGENNDSYSGLFNCEDWVGSIKNGTISAKAYIHHTGRNYDFTLIERK